MKTLKAATQAMYVAFMLGVFTVAFTARPVLGWAGGIAFSAVLTAALLPARVIPMAIIGYPLQKLMPPRVAWGITSIAVDLAVIVATAVAEPKLVWRTVVAAGLSEAFLGVGARATRTAGRAA